VSFIFRRVTGDYRRGKERGQAYLTTLEGELARGDGEASSPALPRRPGTEVARRGGGTVFAGGRR